MGKLSRQMHPKRRIKQMQVKQPCLFRARRGVTSLRYGRVCRDQAYANACGICF